MIFKVLLMFFFDAKHKFQWPVSIPENKHLLRLFLVLTGLSQSLAITVESVICALSLLDLMPICLVKITNNKLCSFLFGQLCYIYNLIVLTLLTKILSKKLFFSSFQIFSQVNFSLL